MNAYTPQDFDHYFRRSWIRGLDDLPVMVRGIDALGNVRVSKDARGTDQELLPLNKLEWHHVHFPPLGYINIGNTGKSVLYLTRRVRRVMIKGFSEDNVVAAFVPQVHYVLAKLGMDADKYTNTSLTSSVVKEAFDPTYKEWDYYMDKLKTKADAVVYAISPNMAIHLGTTKTTAFSLRWKQALVATSEDGNKWRAHSEDCKGMITRDLLGRNIFV